MTSCHDAPTHYSKLVPSDRSPNDAGNGRRLRGFESKKRAPEDRRERGTSHSYHRVLTLLNGKLLKSTKAGLSDNRKRAREETDVLVSTEQRD